MAAFHFPSVAIFNFYPFPAAEHSISGPFREPLSRGSRPGKAIKGTGRRQKEQGGKEPGAWSLQERMDLDFCTSAKELVQLLKDPCGARGLWRDKGLNFGAGEGLP